jgi:hypothetical protein
VNIARDIREDRDWVLQLESELSNRSRLVDQLDEAVGRQDSLIEEENASALIDLLGQRQVVVDEIELGAERLAKLLDRFEREGSQLPLHRITAVRELVQRIADRLDAVLAADARACTSVNGLLSRLSGELEGANQANRAVHAYHAPGTPDARFSDRKA